MVRNLTNNCLNCNNVIYFNKDDNRWICDTCGSHSGDRIKPKYMYYCQTCHMAHSYKPSNCIICNSDQYRFVKINFNNRNRLEAFLHLLIRDYVKVGAIEKILLNIKNNFDFSYDNIHLHKYVKNIIERINNGA